MMKLRTLTLTYLGRPGSTCFQSSKHNFAVVKASPGNLLASPIKTSSRRDTFRSMTTAYSGEIGDGTAGLDDLKYLPIVTSLPNGRKVEIGPFKQDEWERGMFLMNMIIEEGKSWPFIETFDSIDAYRSYFLSHSAFVVRDAEGDGDVMGTFYIKPNYPGRCSHICNGGFITAPEFRRIGVATKMGRAFCKFAKDLGYKSSYFNLVFKSNEASVRLWENLNFERVATLEKAAKLEGVDGLDTAYGYRFDLEKLSDDFEI